MSWDDYTTNLMASNQMYAAGIWGHDGSQWTASAGFSIDPAMAQNIVKACNGDTSASIEVDGMKMITLRGGEEQYLGRKGKKGLAAFLSKSALVVGLYDEEKNHGSGACTVAVGGVADYLKNANL